MFLVFGLFVALAIIFLLILRISAPAILSFAIKCWLTCVIISPVLYLSLDGRLDSVEDLGLDKYETFGSFLFMAIFVGLFFTIHLPLLLTGLIIPMNKYIKNDFFKRTFIAIAGLILVIVNILYYIEPFLHYTIPTALKVVYAIVLVVAIFCFRLNKTKLKSVAEIKNITEVDENFSL